MNTIVHNLNLKRIDAALRAKLDAAAAQKATAEHIALAEFNARVGLQQNVATPTRVSLASLNRPVFQKRGAAPTEKTVSAQGRTENRDEDDPFETETAQLLNVLHRNGSGAMKEWLSQRHDPLERHELLRHAIENSSDGDRAALNEAMQDLVREHGGTLKTALKDAAALKTAVHHMDALSRTDGLAAGSLRATRSLFNVSEDGKLDGPTSALALATRLQARFGSANFSKALKEASAQVGAQMREKNAAPGPRMWLSMSDAASFNAIQSAFSIGCDLRRNLSDANVVPQANEGETAIALLGTASDTGSARKLAERVAGDEQLSMKQKADSYRLVGRAVESLPVTLWPEEKLPQRMDLIDELRSLGGAAAEGLRQARVTKDARLEQMLRQQIALQSRRTAGGE